MILLSSGDARERAEMRRAEVTLLTHKPTGFMATEAAVEAMWTALQQEWLALEALVHQHERNLATDLTSFEGRIHDFARLVEVWWAEVPDGAKLKRLGKRRDWLERAEKSAGNILRMRQRRGLGHA